MDDFDKMEFNVNFDSIPDNEEELKKHLSHEEKKALEKEILNYEKDESKLFPYFLGKPDSPKLTLTHSELLDCIFHSEFFNKELSEEKKKTTGKYLENCAPKNKKFYIREEIIVLIKNLTLVLNNS